MTRRDDELVKAAALQGLAADWRQFVDRTCVPGELGVLRSGERTGRPLGAASFVRGLEALLKRPLLPKKPGRKRKEGR